MGDTGQRDSSPAILVFADDLTGALEVGAKFATYGHSAMITTGLTPSAWPNCSVLVVDTETRHLTAEQAAARIRCLADIARSASPRIIYKKTDSTLRGNIGAEFNALHDAFPGQLLAYVPAYPDMGRTVKNGQLFVWGTRVHETEFGTDQGSPVRDSRIAAVLGNGPTLVLDCESNGDIDAVVTKILEGSAPGLCAGPSALAEALARRLGPGLSRSALVSFTGCTSPKCLVVNGSLHPVSIEQMKQAEQLSFFDQDWRCLVEPIEGTGNERSMRAGQCVQRILASWPFTVLIVFGGDTAFGIHSVLGGAAFESLGEIAPGVPLSKSGELLWITKAGGFGPPEILSTIRKRLT